jgi:hypothetical protein
MMKLVKVEDEQHSAVKRALLFLFKFNTLTCSICIILDNIVQL